MLDFLHELIRAQISALDSSTKFVFIQPTYLPQHAILEMFMQEPSCLYVRFAGSTSSHKSAAETLQISLRQQFPHGSLSDVRLLILDECDLAEPTELEAVLTGLLEMKQIRVLLLSREVPDFMRMNSLIGAQTRILPVDARLMFPDYIAENRRNLLEVRALGSGYVFLNGKPVTDWDGELPRDLFFFFIDKGMVTRTQIFEAFWPDLPIKEATNVFHVTKRKINEILGLNLTQHSGSFYRLSPDVDLFFDVALFKDLMQQSVVADTEDARELLTRAIWLYRGDFLSALEPRMNLWVQTRRHELSQLYGEALFALGKVVEKSGDDAAALGLFIRASALNRQREDLAGNIMSLHQKRGEFTDALKTYERIETDIAESLGISPAQWLQDLAANIREESRSMPLNENTKLSR